jgi:hypothetical protein
MCAGDRQNLLVTAPAALRERLAGRYEERLIQTEPEIPTAPTGFSLDEFLTHP